MKKAILFLLLLLVSALAFTGFASPVYELSKQDDLPFAEDASLLKLYVINTHGASDAMLMVHDGKTMLIDCGDTRYGSLFVKPLMDTLGIDHIDYAFNTHPHDDHINGFLSLFDEVKVDVFYTCFPMSYCAEQSAVMKSAMEHGIDIRLVDNDSDISFGDLSIWLYQDPMYMTAQPSRANSASMIMHITLGGSTLMITGDAEKPVFTDLYSEKGDAIQSDIFKVPHHGYNTPSYDVFRSIAPQYAVVTNYYSEKIESGDQFLRNNRCLVMYTGRGTVELVTDGAIWTIRQLTEY
ncbi:MAG: MBL fold metallo-hydrolase [Clostridia bacterium]|nr:MBL fold metallo-hydrolase [Clostridia bacterium]